MTSSMDIERPDETTSEERLITLIRREGNRESVLSALRTLLSRRSQSRLAISEEVLGNPKQPLAARKTIATVLGTEQIDEHQRLLLRYLDTDSPYLFARMVSSLGKIGDEKAAEYLNSVRPRENATAAMALRFAKALLAYRLRLDRNLLQPPEADDFVRVEKGEQLSIKNADPDMVKLALSEARDSVPAIPLTDKGALYFTCRENEYVLAVAEDFRLVKGMRSLASQPALPFLLFKRGLSLHRFSLDTYFFTQPKEKSKEIAIIGTRASGPITYGGSAELIDAGLQVYLQSIDTRYAPAIEIQGTYNYKEGSWDNEKAVTSMQVAAKKNKAETPKKIRVLF